jgi:hypothetical protein
MWRFAEYEKRSIIYIGTFTDSKGASMPKTPFATGERMFREKDVRNLRRTVSYKGRYKAPPDQTSRLFP